MVTLIGYITIAVIAIFAIKLAIKLFVAVLPLLFGIVAIIIALLVIGALFASNNSCDSYTPSAIQHEAITYTTATESVQPIAEPAYYERNEEQAKYHEKALNQVFQKEGVNLTTLQPAMDSAIFIIAATFEYVIDGFYIPTITSGDDYDGHCDGSAHYSGAALDFRLKDIDDPDLREMVTVAVRENLGDRFFVDHEFPGEDNEHLHVQLRRGTYSKVAWR